MIMNGSTLVCWPFCYDKVEVCLNDFQIGDIYKDLGEILLRNNVRFNVLQACVVINAQL